MLPKHLKILVLCVCLGFGLASPGIAEPSVDPSLSESAEKNSNIVDLSKVKVEEEEDTDAKHEKEEHGKAIERFKSKAKTMGQWVIRYFELLKYKKTYGHLKISPKIKKYKSLARFAEDQRRFYKQRKEGEKTSVTKERVEMLEAIDFVWALPESRAPSQAKSQTVPR